MVVPIVRPTKEGIQEKYPEPWETIVGKGWAIRKKLYGTALVATVVYFMGQEVKWQVKEKGVTRVTDSSFTQDSRIVGAGTAATVQVALNHIENNVIPQQEAIRLSLASLRRSMH